VVPPLPPFPPLLALVLAPLLALLVELAPPDPLVAELPVDDALWLAVVSVVSSSSQPAAAAATSMVRAMAMGSFMAAAEEQSTCQRAAGAISLDWRRRSQRAFTASCRCGTVSTRRK
jgi:hypothetical protein